MSRLDLGFTLAVERRRSLWPCPVIANTTAMSRSRRSQAPLARLCPSSLVVELDPLAKFDAVAMTRPCHGTMTVHATKPSPFQSRPQAPVTVAARSPECRCLRVQPGPAAAPKCRSPRVHTHDLSRSVCTFAMSYPCHGPSLCCLDRVLALALLPPCPVRNPSDAHTHTPPDTHTHMP